MGIIGKVLSATDTMFSGIGQVAKGAGSVGLKGADLAFRGAAKGAEVAGFASISPLRQAGNAVKGLGKKMVRRAPEKTHWDAYSKEFVVDQEGGLKLTKLGMGVIFGTGALGSLQEGSHTVEGKGLGQADSKVYTPTPEITPQQYSNGFVDNGGATGDLVFALHKNR